MDAGKKHHNEIQVHKEWVSMACQKKGRESERNVKTEINVGSSVMAILQGKFLGSGVINGLIVDWQQFLGRHITCLCT